MDAQTAESYFNEADTLYRDGRYAEALDRLVELDEAYPNTPNILFPLARCLRHIGRIDESLAICDDLITRCGDLRALQLREYIRKSHPPGAESPLQPQVHSIEGLNQEAHAGALDDLLQPPPALPPPLPHSAEPKSYKKHIIAGAIALAAVAVLVPVLFFATSSASVGVGPPAAEAVGTGPGIAIPMFIIVLLAANIGVLYLTLMLRQKFVYESTTDNLINVGFMGVGLAVLNTVLLCIGLIPTYFILRKVYEFTFVDFLIWFALNAAVGTVLSLVLQFTVGSPLM